MRKLEKLCEIEGKTLEEILSEATFDSLADSICTNLGCSYTTKMEPDQDRGWCECCGTPTVASCLVLAGIV